MIDTIKFITIAALLLTGCTSATPYGKCVGVNGQKDQTLRYEYSARNIILGSIFIELIAPPVFVILDELECPVGKK